jgi:error-prone DNA polymerase
VAAARDGRRISVAGMVLVRQRPGSASGVTFVTIEDETGVANLVVWLPVFERHRRIVLSAGLLACHGRVQREGEVLHVVADWLEDLSSLLRSIEQCGGADSSCQTRGDAPSSTGVNLGAYVAHDVTTRNPRPGSGIRVPTRDFR